MSYVTLQGLGEVSQEAYNQLVAEVNKAREGFIKATSEALSSMSFLSYVGSEMPEHYRNLRDTLVHTVFEVRIPSLLEKFRQGDESAAARIKNVLEVNANSFKEAYLDAVKDFRDMGAVTTLTLRAVSGLVAAASFAGGLAAEKAKQLIQEAMDEAAKDPAKAVGIGVAVMAGVAGLIALRLFLSKRR